MWYGMVSNRKVLHHLYFTVPAKAILRVFQIGTGVSINLKICISIELFKLSVLRLRVLSSQIAL